MFLDLSKVRGTVFLKGFYLTLCAESEDGPEWKEISVLSLENIVVTLENNKVTYSYTILKNLFLN